MLTYIMQFNLTICYIRGSSNTIRDSSRLFQDSSPQERPENEAKYMHEVDDYFPSNDAVSKPYNTRTDNGHCIGRAHSTAAAGVVAVRADPA